MQDLICNTEIHPAQFLRLIQTQLRNKAEFAKHPAIIWANITILLSALSTILHSFSSTHSGYSLPRATLGLYSHPELPRTQLKEQKTPAQPPSSVLTGAGPIRLEMEQLIRRKHGRSCTQV